MAKFLKSILEDKRLEGVKKSTTVPGHTGDVPGVDYDPKAPEDQKFVAIHDTEKHASRAGNGPDVFAGAKQKPALSTPQAKHMGRKNLKDAMKVNEEEIEEKYLGFGKLKAALSHKSGIKDPGALAASIGREKYGKAKFQKAAAADHKMKEDVEVDEAAECNHTPAGTKCPMHYLADCSGMTGKSKHLLVDKKVNEDVAIDESIADRKAHSDHMHLIAKTGKTNTGATASKALRDKAHAFIKQKQSNKTVAKEDVQIDEVLTAKDPASKWIHDFIHSDNPKFAGKSKKERQQQALAAYYSKKRSVKEDAAEPMLEGGKKKKLKKESGPDSQMVPNGYTNVKADTGYSI